MRVKRGKKKDDSVPLSHKQLTWIVSSPFTRMILLVSKVLLPRSPLLIELRAQAAICSSSSGSILTVHPQMLQVCALHCVWWETDTT